MTRLSTSSPARCRSGFTLLEILTVVLILGILAAVAIPQFGYVSDDARHSAAVRTLQTLRAQIQLYRLQYSSLPNLTGGWECMLSSGTDGGGKPIMPHLVSTPANPYLPLAISSSVLSTTNPNPGMPPSAAASDCAFIYDYADGSGTGQIWITNKDARTPMGL